MTATEAQILKIIIIITDDYMYTICINYDYFRLKIYYLFLQSEEVEIILYIYPPINQRQQN